MDHLPGQIRRKESDRIEKESEIFRCQDHTGNRWLWWVWKSKRKEILCHSRQQEYWPLSDGRCECDDTRVAMMTCTRVTARLKQNEVLVFLMSTVP
jgi:hypothetical protein